MIVLRSAYVALRAWVGRVTDGHLPKQAWSRFPSLLTIDLVCWSSLVCSVCVKEVYFVNPL